MSTLAIASTLEFGFPLTADERADKERLEAVITRGVVVFIEVASALAEIHEKGYYKETHATFEAYVQQKWDHNRDWAYRLLRAGEVSRNLALAGLPAPKSERQIRPLVKLSPDTQREVWEEANKETPKPTAKQVQAAVEKVAPETVKPKLATAASLPIPVATADSEPDESEEVEPEIASEVAEEEWLQTLPIRSSLQGYIRDRFDADALAFRQVSKARQTFYRALKPVTDRAKRKCGRHIGRWAGKIAWTLRMRDPMRWNLCNTCKGSAQELNNGSCHSCKGHGYFV